MFKITKDLTAIKACRNLLRKNPDDLSARLVMGMIRLFQKDWDKARTNFSLAIRIAQKKDNTDMLGIAYNWRGKAAVKQLNLHLALKDFVKAEEICKKNANYPCLLSARQNMAFVLFRRGDYRRAEQLFIRNVKLSKETYNRKEYAAGLLGLSLVQFKVGRIKMACKLLKKSGKLITKLPAKNSARKTYRLLAAKCPNFAAETL